MIEKGYLASEKNAEIIEHQIKRHIIRRKKNVR